MSELEPVHLPARSLGTRLALALGGGAARGLAHIGVLEVLEREGIRPDCLVGSSMGGVIGALSAAGLRPRDIAEIARGFRFPRWFIPSGTVHWDPVFAPAVPILSARSFEELDVPLVVTAVDLEEGTQVILHAGPVLPAVRATCAVPGVLPPVRLGGRWLVDGGLVNVLPVDVAWLVEPDVVIAVKVGARRARKMPELNWRLTGLLSRLGTVIPNPGTAKVSFSFGLRRASGLLACGLLPVAVPPVELVPPRHRGVVGDQPDTLPAAIIEVDAKSRELPTSNPLIQPGGSRQLGHQRVDEAAREVGAHRIGPVAQPFARPGDELGRMDVHATLRVRNLGGVVVEVQRAARHAWR